MSPIGRVFIVLNLALAGGFLVFSGTHLQQQHDYKSALEKAQTESTEVQKQLNAQIQMLTNERTTLEVAKQSRETELTATKNNLDQQTDENKRLSQLLASMDGDLKALRSSAEAANTLSKTAHEQAEAAYKMAMADQKVKDEAVRAKDAAVAESRSLTNTIASLQATIQDKDGALADLTKERNELNLLVSVAQENGFVPGLAAPTLSGTVAHAAGNLCTIVVTDNPGEVDIADQLAKRKFSFAIYDASGYKGEAVATAYHAGENAITCRLTLQKGQIKAGDNASTKTP